MCPLVLDPLFGNKHLKKSQTYVDQLLFEFAQINLIAEFVLAYMRTFNCDVKLQDQTYLCMVGYIVVSYVYIV